MQNKMKKSKFYMIAIIAMTVLSMQSCTKDDSNTIY